MGYCCFRSEVTNFSIKNKLTFNIVLYQDITLVFSITIFRMLVLYVKYSDILTSKHVLSFVRSRDVRCDMSRDQDIWHWWHWDEWYVTEIWSWAVRRDCEIWLYDVEMWGECNLRSEMWDLRYKIWEASSKIWDLRYEIWDVKCKTWVLRSEMWVVRSDMCDLRCETWNDWQQKLRQYNAKVLGYRLIDDSWAIICGEATRQSYLNRVQYEANIVCYRMWSEPVPKLSSPHSDIRPESIRLPKNFQPVGVTKSSFPFAWATLCIAW